MPNNTENAYATTPAVYRNRIGMIFHWKSTFRLETSKTLFIMYDKDTNKKLPQTRKDSPLQCIFSVPYTFTVWF